MTQIKILLMFWLHLLLVQCSDEGGTHDQVNGGFRSLRGSVYEARLSLDALREEEWVQNLRRRLDYIPDSHRLISKEDLSVPNGNFSFASPEEEEACKGN